MWKTSLPCLNSRGIKTYSCYLFFFLLAVLTPTWRVFTKCSADFFDEKSVHDVKSGVICIYMRNSVKETNNNKLQQKMLPLGDWVNRSQRSTRLMCSCWVFHNRTRHNMDTLSFDVEIQFVNALMSFKGTLKMVGGKDHYDIMQKEICQHLVQLEFSQSL